MMKIKIDLSLDQKISSYLAIMLLMILSFLVAWFTLDKAQEIIDNAKESASFNTGIRVQNQLLEKK